MYVFSATGNYSCLITGLHAMASAAIQPPSDTAKLAQSSAFLILSCRHLHTLYDLGQVGHSFSFSGPLPLALT